MTTKGLQLVPLKTEAVMLIKRRNIKRSVFRIGDVIITPAKSVKYLGVHIDENFRVTVHIRQVTLKVEETFRALARILPNVGGPETNKRGVLMLAAYSVVLYAAPMWQEALKFRKYREVLERMQRRALLRVRRAYRTTSTLVLQVIGGTPPTDLLVEERSMRFRMICLPKVLKNT